eukprot:TRINITY_DN70827_c0_g1_i1.p1 TRINITY_DN70827_c0_g1~~TRINITY_DN70827_c0_g1_i1.p1  ORF type:complete len:742 (+),score=223.92 TRINITY_DN70827_c0_g1_i1:75-2228(+)
MPASPSTQPKAPPPGRAGPLILDEWSRSAAMYITSEEVCCEQKNRADEATPLLSSQDSVKTPGTKKEAPWKAALLAAAIGSAAALLSAGVNWGMTALTTWKGIIPLWQELLFRMGFAVLAVCVTNVAPMTAAGGSGIPQVRALLQGISVQTFFRKSTFWAKVLGLSCAILAGYSIGSEGPFLHITAIMAVQSLRVFPAAAPSATAALDIVTAACASGVAANFGAPLAGVIFAIELSHSYYRIKSLLLCVTAAVAGSLTLRGLRLSQQVALFSSDLSQLDPVPTINPMELVLVAMVGVACGCVASLYIFVFPYLLRFRDSHVLAPGLSRPQWWLRALGCAVALAALQAYVNSWLQMVQNNSSHRAPLSDLFSVNGATPGFIPDRRLVRLLCARFSLSQAALLLPVPCGVALPSFEMGAAMGRLISHTADYLELDCDVHCAVRLSLCGGAAFCSAITHTLSPGLLVLELTGQGNEVANIFAAVIIALLVSRSLCTGGLFDITQDVCAVPAMPVALSPQTASRIVKDILPDTWLSLRFAQADGKDEPPPHAQILLDGNRVRIAEGKSSDVIRALSIADKFDLKAIPLTSAAKGVHALVGEITTKRLMSMVFRLQTLKEEEVEWAPLTVGAYCSLGQVDRMFSALNPAVIYVVSRGELVGILPKLHWVQEVNGALKKRRARLQAIRKAARIIMEDFHTQRSSERELLRRSGLVNSGTLSSV